MATKKTGGKKTSSGSDSKSKQIVKKKVGEVMHEFKHHELESGRSGKKVKNPKQAIAIGLSEARRSGANLPPDPNQRQGGAKKGAASKKRGVPKAESSKGSAKKASSRRSVSTATKKKTKK